MTDSEQFRVETRRWLEENCPPAMRTGFETEADWVWGGRHPSYPNDEARLWLERMVARGWTAPDWPKQYGGAGLSPSQTAILEEEMRRLGCRLPLKSFGLWMLGPVLLEFGSDEQKAEYLPPIARGEIRWCQGYSEPGAGSDLASLATRAELDGDCFVVDGQKIWTSHADKSDWMFCLVRTGPDAPKHEGIGFLLIDMQSPGISVRPIRLISGASPFCETFFDRVRVPARNLVGKANQGWTIAKALLKHERALIARARGASSDNEEPLPQMARRYIGPPTGELADAQLRDRITQSDLDALCFRLTMKRSAEQARVRGAPGPETSMFKLYGTEWSKRRKELKLAIAGFAALGWEGAGFTAEELQLTREWLRSRASSIEGGTSEIQMNIIARHVLGLPD